MKFTIGAGSFYTEYRLKTDGNFKKFNEKDSKIILPDDKVFTDYYEAKSYVRNKEIITTEEETIVVAEKIGINARLLGSTHLFVESHRIQRPEKVIFTLEEIKNVLKNGDDSKTNVLVITSNGDIKLVPLDGIHNHYYAVRHEAFVAGNGYVGTESELNHANDTYLSMLNGWKLHLSSHKSIFVDYHDNYNADSIIAEINTLLTT